ncbi:sodium:calcium antiporter [Gemmata sp. G18]|uniref:Sodium:calcium antiporter n=1 Tax=Gemmata palustris TaxID=2822762 RepID=A0ABS5BYY0_9BACT|nr:sodium:calcium antiporter [Gemmata palustris]MBP3958863.1 sodium:calcium antiporter [Gemmata palustris]
MSEFVVLFAVGLLLLAVGSTALVLGAARLDRATGRSAFAVGLVAVGFGPCVAGLAFDLAAVLHKLPRLAMGNVIGGNIASIGLVLGAAVLVRPITGTAKLFATAIPLVIVAALLFWFLARDNKVERIEAGVLLVAGLGALALLIHKARQESEPVKAEFAAWVPNRLSMWTAGGLVLAGLGALIGGAVLVTTNANETVRRLSLDSHRLGLVSAGVMALPALVAAVCAARRGRSNLVLGLAVGPALFNLLLVVGTVAMVRPLLVIEGAILNEVPAMALFTLLLVTPLANGLRVSRGEGAILLVACAGFVAWQVTKK